MTSNDDISHQASELRRLAEKIALEKPALSLEDIQAMSVEEIQQILHELRVHQIELAMQNEELRTAQTEIDAGRARYFDLYDLAPVGYCTLSEEGLIIEANFTTATLLGMARGMLIKKPLSRFILKDDQDIYFLHRKQLFETGKPQQCELRLVKPDGALFWARLAGTADQGVDGVAACRVVITDIGERKRAEDELQRNLTMLARTEHLANIGSWEWDIDADCTRWSEELFRIFQRDLALGAPSLAEHPVLYLAEDMERLWAAVEKCISNGTPYELELSAIRTDGMIRQCVARGKAECDEKGRIIRLVGSLQDITERKEVEKELRKSESLFRTLVNTIPDLIWLKDADGVYLSCNKRFERFFGASETEIRGKTDYDFVDKELADLFREYDRKALAVGGISRNEEQITDADDGHTILLETIKTPMFDSGGNLVGVLGIGRDITERKQAEEALKDSSVRISLATKAAGVGVWEYDIVHNRLEWDEQMFALYGISRETFGGAYESWRACVHPEDMARADEEEKMALCGEKDFDTEFRVVWPDGTVRNIQALAMVLRDADGKPLRTIGTNWDITERKQAEEALREQRNFSESLIETAQTIILVLDTKGRIVRFNPYMEELAGYALDEVKGMDWFETFLTPEIDRTIKPLFQKTVADVHTSGNVNPIIAKDGRAILVEWYNKTLKNKDGYTVGILAIGQDITERKQAEEALRVSQQFNKQIIRSAKEGIIVYGPDLRYQAWNPFMEQMTGIMASEVLGKYPTEMFPFLQETGIIERLGKVLAEEIVNSIEFPFCLESTGKSGWNRDSSAPFYNEKGEIVGVIGIVSDITESKRLEEEQKMLQAQLQQAQKMEAIGTLAGGIAHDFNNILGAILGYAEMAQEDSPAGSILRQDIDQIVKAGHRARELVKQILAFSRQAETERIPLQPASIIKEAIRMLRSSLPSTIEIKQNIDMDAGLIQASPTQIHQIVMNLGTNAFHAMEETGGTLVISLEKKTLNERDIVDKPGVQPGDFVQLSVGDTGPGIAPELWDKIFDPYFTTKEVGKGTGLGLAIIHGIVKSYGGWVSFQSHPGKGTVFKVLLPLMAEEALVENKPEETVQFGNERILFIDDEEILAEMGKSMLERLGYQVTVQSSSLEALRIFQNQPDTFDLVITDQTMPGMTGSDLARRILQIRPFMPIILCTGYSSIITEEKARLFGIKGFAMKPLTRKNLAVLIREVLDGGHLLSLNSSQ